MRKHGLFDLPGICSPHALYTDADVIFPNPLTVNDMHALKSFMIQRDRMPNNGKEKQKNIWKALKDRRDKKEPPIIMYDRESVVHDTNPTNTGVMLMDVPRFGNELTVNSLLRFRNEHPDPKRFQAFDQGWMNLYFSQNEERRAFGHLLPIHWNWKLYWTLEPSHFDDLKIVHVCVLNFVGKTNLMLHSSLTTVPIDCFLFCFVRSSTDPNRLRVRGRWLDAKRI